MKDREKLRKNAVSAQNCEKLFDSSDYHKGRKVAYLKIKRWTPKACFIYTYIKKEKSCFGLNPTKKFWRINLKDT